LHYVLIHNTTHPLNQPVLARYCTSFMCRLRGFTFRRELSPDEAILLVQSKDSRLDAAIHMFAVWTDLSVVWINNAGDVVDLCIAQAWHPFYVPSRPARYVLEMAPGRHGAFQAGDKVEIEEVFVD
jgi:uncharacterized membrane protein (UPF0127 family)